MDDQLDNLLREIIGVRDELQRHHDNNYLQDLHQLKRLEADRDPYASPGVGSSLPEVITEASGDFEHLLD